jgi:hypothetical protein
MTYVYDPEAVDAGYSVTAGRTTPPDMEWMMKVDHYVVETWISQKRPQCSCGCEPDWKVYDDLIRSRTSPSGGEPVNRPFHKDVYLKCRACGEIKRFSEEIMRNAVLKSAPAPLQAGGDDTGG